MPRAKPSLDRLLQPLRRTARPVRRSASPDDNPAVVAIWHVIAAIPAGCVSTYGDVARAAGFPRRARLTAYALRTAGPDMHLPWHRVLGAGGRIVFPKNSRQYREQARLLRSEGVPVTLGRVPVKVIWDTLGA
jgi:methylated-DNA-protein-cysteine methyltransferase-like protein